MFYLSQILGDKIKDSSDKVVGKIKDLVVKQGSGVYSPIEFVLIKEKKTKKECLIPYKYVENLGGKELTLKTLYCNITTEKVMDHYLYLDRDIFDQQIVDLDGVRIVRVNDLKLGVFQDRICVLGIDVSFKGLLRRLGLERIDFLNILKTYLIDWRKAQPIHGHLQVKSIAQDLVKLHPADLANLVEKLNLDDASILLHSLDQATAARVMEELQPTVQEILIKHLDPDKAAALVGKMSVDELVDLIQSLPPEDAQAIMDKMPRDTKIQKVTKILQYEEDEAGGLMSAEYITAYVENRVEDLIEKIKKVSSEYTSIHFIYIIDHEGRFKGVVSLRRLLISDKKQTLKEIMHGPEETPVADVKASLLSVASLVTKYNLMSIAVVDKEKRLLGVITVDDLMRHFVPHA